MGQPKQKPSVDEPKFTASPEVLAELQEALADEPIGPIDLEAHVRWLETGEGEPWPLARSS